MSNPKKILILGATGMLGHKLCIGLSQNPHFQVATTMRDNTDPLLTKVLPPEVQILNGIHATNEKSLEELFQKNSPDVVINCIGIVKQNQEAKDYIASISINSLFPHKMAKLCQKLNIRFIHISTDCVFSGKLGQPYTEQMNSDAEDLYGKSKFLGEVIDLPNALTLRTSIIGREIKHPTGLLEWFLSQKQKQAKGFSRALYSGLTTNLAVDVLTKVILEHTQLHGLYQVATEAISKFDLLQIINEIYETNVKIAKDENFFCDRRLNGSAFAQATGWSAPSWTELIRDMHRQDLEFYAGTPFSS